jgi:hypothetical protein
MGILKAIRRYEEWSAEQNVARKAARKAAPKGFSARVEAKRGDRDPSYWDRPSHVIDTPTTEKSRDIEALIALYAEHGYTLAGTTSKTFGGKVLTFTKS